MGLNLFKLFFQTFLGKKILRIIQLFIKFSFTFLQWKSLICTQWSSISSWLVLSRAKQHFHELESVAEQHIFSHEIKFGRKKLIGWYLALKNVCRTHSQYHFSQ